MFTNFKNDIKKLNLWIVVFSVLFSAMLVVSNHVIYDWKTAVGIYVTDFHFIDMILFLIYTPIVCIGMKVLEVVFYQVNLVFFGYPRESKKLVFVGIFLFIMVLWVPYFMSYWPGGIYSDTVDSLDMALGKKAWDNHNPLLYTLIWRFMFWITGAFRGEGVYGGLKLFTVVQSGVLALAMSGFIYSCYKKGVHKAILILEVLLVAVFPLYPFYGISLWKDTVFSVAIFVFSVFLYHLFEKKEEDISNINLTVYGIMTVLIIFLRNNGIYIAIFYSVVLFLLYLKDKKMIGKKLGIVSGIIIVVSCIIQGPIYDNLGYTSDKKTESLGIPMQQVAYIYTTDGRVNAEELEVLNNIIPLENWKNLYNPMVVDSIKFDPGFNKIYFEEHAGEFLKVYFSMVIKNPVKAVKAYFMQTMGFWDILKSSPVAYICNFHFGNAEYFMSDYFSYYLGVSFREYVEPKIYLSAAIFVWMMLGAVFICLARKNYSGMICLLPTLGLWLSIMIAVPVAFSFRYVYSIFLCAPLYIMVGIGSCRK